MYLHFEDGDQIGPSALLPQTLDLHNITFISHLILISLTLQKLFVTNRDVLKVVALLP